MQTVGAVTVAFCAMLEINYIFQFSVEIYSVFSIVSNPSYMMLAGNPCNDFFQFDPSTGVWTTLMSSNVPTARYGHGFEVAGSRLYVYGGFSGSGVLYSFPSVT